MLDPRTRMLDPDDLKRIAARLALASRSSGAKRQLQADLVLASRLILALLRARVIDGPVDLEEGQHER